jgi:hypothetical protein
MKVKQAAGFSDPEDNHNIRVTSGALATGGGPDVLTGPDGHFAHSGGGSLCGGFQI